MWQYMLTSLIGLLAIQIPVVYIGSTRSFLYFYNYLSRNLFIIYYLLFIYLFINLFIYFYLKHLFYLFNLFIYFYLILCYFIIYLLNK